MINNISQYKYISDMLMCRGINYKTFFLSCTLTSIVNMLLNPTNKFIAILFTYILQSFLCLFLLIVTRLTIIFLNKCMKYYIFNKNLFIIITIISLCFTTPIIFLTYIFSNICLLECSFGFMSSILSMLSIKVGMCLFTKAADITSDIYGKCDMNIKEDSNKNPLTVLDNLGDLLGDMISSICNMVIFILFLLQYSNIDYLKVLSLSILSILFSQIVSSFIVNQIHIYVKHIINNKYFIYFNLNKILSYCIFIFIINVNRSLNITCSIFNVYTYVIVLINIFMHSMFFIKLIMNYLIKYIKSHIFIIIYIFSILLISCFNTFINLMCSILCTYEYYALAINVEIKPWIYCILTYIVILSIYEDIIAVFGDSIGGYSSYLCYEELAVEADTLDECGNIIKYINKIFSNILIYIYFMIKKSYYNIDQQMSKIGIYFDDLYMMNMTLNITNIILLITTCILIMFFIKIILYCYQNIINNSIMNIKNNLLQICTILGYIIVFITYFIIHLYINSNNISLFPLIEINTLFIIFCTIGTMFDIGKKHFEIKNDVQNEITQYNNIKNQLVICDTIGDLMKDTIYPIYISVLNLLFICQ